VLEDDSMLQCCKNIFSNCSFFVPVPPPAREIEIMQNGNKQACDTVALSLEVNKSILLGSDGNDSPEIIAQDYAAQKSAVCSTKRPFDTDTDHKPSAHDVVANISPSMPRCQYLFVIQFVELLRKRFIISSRDKKGMFFQVLFPVLQIIAILFILTININPAGKSLKLNANMYKVKTVVDFAGVNSISHYVPTNRILVEDTMLTNSTALSR
jgi:hypothetical protein